MQSIKIGKKLIGEEKPVFIIAEIGVNHNGDLNLAKKLVEKAKECGVDCVKFQTFKAERVASAAAPKAPYQLRTTSSSESQVEMLRKLELSEDAHKELLELCDKLNIIFLSTPYSLEDIDFLDCLGVPAFKVASGQAVEPYFLRYMGEKKKPIILSTGMCTLGEVDNAVRTIRGTGNEEIVVLQCTTNYPSAPEDANLLAMQTMRDALKVLVGYSDHTVSLSASIAAVALGACVIERHFTLDKNMPGPDHSCSSEPEEFLTMVKTIREVKACLGTGIKEPNSAEIENLSCMRRSIVAKRKIKAGEKFSLENLTLKRPFDGLSASFMDVILGKRAGCDILPDTFISLGMIK
jgi:N-acetylneuraminate synthase/N,N'-diacetyllegionaminate synthase